MRKKFLVLCVLFLSYAYSQVYESPGITVVGKRLNDSLLQSGNYGSAQVITKEEIAQSTAKTIPALLQEKIGLTKYSNATGNDLDWTLSYGGFSSGTEFVVIVDGIRYNEADDNVVYWSNLPVADIERIEFLPGAQSAIFGGGAFAGVVYITTKKATVSQIDVSAGSYGYGRQNLVLGNSWNNFYYKLNYDHKAATGYRNYSGYDSQLLNGRVGWVDKTQEVNLNYSWADSAMKYPVQLTEDELNDLNDRQKSPNGAHSTRRIETDMMSVEYIKNFNDTWKTSFLLGKRDRAVEYKNLTKSGWNDSFMKEFEDANNYVAQITFKERLSFGHETRLADIDSYTYDYNRNTKKKDTPYNSRYEATKGEYAYFVQYVDKFGPLALRYGVRDDVVDYVNYDKVGQERTDKKFSERTHNGELGLDVLPGTQVYVNYSEAFKAPTFSGLFRSNPGWGSYANENLSAELAITQRSGVRFSNKQGFNFNWSVYRTMVDDEIIYVETAPWTYTNENAKKTQRDGYDIFASQKIGSWQIWGNYAFVKARFVDFDNYGTDCEGMEIPMVPEETYSLGLTWQKNKFSSSLVYSFVGNQYLDDDTANEGDKFAAYGFGDLKLNYQATDDLSCYLNVNNVFNNIYNTKGLWGFGGPINYTPADLRSAAIGMKWQF